jgi:hypothetical protein
MLTIAGATVIRRITIAMTMFAEALALVRAAQLTQGEQEPVDVIIVGVALPVSAPRLKQRIRHLT